MRLSAFKIVTLLALCTIVSCQKEQPSGAETVDLSKDGTANCYIVSDAGKYKIKSVRGNSSEVLASVSSAAVLWETFGTDKTPSVGDVIASAEYSDGYIVFSTPDNLCDGNAVIVAKDASGDILWSWHIWVCKGFDPSKNAHTYNNDAGVVMDRNLGATSSVPGDVRALGLLYQWGRKDPFLSFDKISDTESQAASTISWPPSVEGDENTGTIEYTLKNPATFVRWGINGDWYYTGGYITDNERWRPSNKEKGLYDPCPYGWRVPDGGENGLWAKAFGSSSYFTDGPWQSSNRGMDFGTGNGLSKDKQLGTSDVIWYPAVGNKAGNDGTLQFAGRLSHLWTASPIGIYVSIQGLDKSNTTVYPDAQSERAYALSVRCVKESH